MPLAFSKWTVVIARVVLRSSVITIQCICNRVVPIILVTLLHIHAAVSIDGQLPDPV